MKKLFILAIGLSFFISAKAQYSKVIYGELMGPGLLGSLNYDMRLSEKEDGLGFRAGIGGVFLPLIIEKGITFPLELNYLIGKNNKSYLELGAGVSFLSIGSSSGTQSNELNTTYAFGTVGYRYAPANGGLFFKIAFNPLIGNVFVPYGGIGLGYKF